MKRIILLIAPIFLLFSCVDYYVFTLNKSRIDNPDINPIGCKIMSHYSKVNHKLGQNTIEIYPGGRVAMGVEFLTQLHADFTVNIFEGDGVRFTFRTAEHNFDIHPAIVFDYTTNGCTVRENETILANISSIKAKLNEEFRIFIDNTGAQYNIVVDCDTVYKGRTSIPASEYVVVETLNSSSARLSGIDFDEYIETSKFMR